VGEGDSKRVVALEQTVAGKEYQVTIEKRCGLLSVFVTNNTWYAQTTIPCGTNFQNTLLLVDEFKLQPAKTVEFYSRGGFINFDEAVKLLNLTRDDVRYKELEQKYSSITEKLYPPGEWVV